MRKSPRFMLAAGLIGLALTTSTVGAQEKAKPAEPVAAKEIAKPAEPNGKELAFNNRKGNCLACHLMPSVPDAITSATIGPPLIAMKSRFPDKAKLRDQIADATKVNPASSMPPFGKHGIISDKEIDLITDFVHGI